MAHVKPKLAALAAILLGAVVGAAQLSVVPIATFE